MNISLAEARTHLSDLIDQVSKGGEVTITKRGKPVATLTAVKTKRRRVDAAALRKIADQMPFQETSAGEFVRAMRDGDRY